MLNLRLKKKQQWYQIDLRPGTGIVVEQSHDLLALEVETADRTYPFELPSSPRNVAFFGAAGNHSLTSDMFREYEAELAYRNSYKLKGLFKLTDVKAGYKGFLKARQSQLAKVKDRPIGELIDLPLATQALPVQVTVNNDMDRIVYPTVLMPNFFRTKDRSHTEVIQGYGTKTIFDSAGFFNYRHADGYTDPDGHNILPVPRLLSVLEALLQAVGYRVQYNCDVTDLYKIILFGKAALGRAAYFSEATMAEALPDTSVSEFLRSLRVSFGMKFTWKEDKVEIDLVRDLVKAEEALDITRYLSPDPLRQDQENLYEFAFAGEGEELLSEFSELPPVMFRHQIPAGASQLIPPSVFVVAENRYYKYSYAGGWEPMERTYHPEGSGTRMETKLPPVKMVSEAELQFRTLCIDNKQNVGNADGWRITQLFPDGWIDIDSQPEELRIVSPSEYASEYVPLRTNSFGGEYFIVPVKSGGEAIPFPTVYQELGVILQIRKKLPFVVPMVEETGYSNFYQHRNDSFKPFMAFYHGITPRINGAGEFCCASSSNYDSAGIRRVPFALRYTGEDGLVAYFWQDALDLLSKTEKVTVTGRLPLHFLAGYDGRQKLRIRNAVFMPVLFRYQLTENGLQACTLELRQLKHAKDQYDDLPQGVLWEADEASFVSDTDGTFILVQ